MKNENGAGVVRPGRIIEIRDAQTQVFATEHSVDSRPGELLLLSDVYKSTTRGAVRRPKEIRMKPFPRRRTASVRIFVAACAWAIALTAMAAAPPEQSRDRLLVQPAWLAQ